MVGSTKGNSLYFDRNKLVYLFIFYLLLSLLIVFADRRGFLTDFRRFVQGFTIPVESRLFALRKAVLSPFSVFFSTSDKDKRLQELEKENARLLGQLSQLESIEEENIKARHLLGATLSPSWHFEPARVTSVFADRMFLVSDGRAEAGMPAITSQDKSGVFVGQVKEIVGKRAAVTLPTNTPFKTTAIARDKETGGRNGTGILVGRGTGLVLEQVLASEGVKEGDLVLTAGDENLPPELLVGYVTRVYDIKGTFKEAEVKMAIDPAKLDFVFLVTKF